MRRNHTTRAWLACTALAFFCTGTLVLAAEGAGPADPPPEYRAAEPETVEGPSVIAEELAGIAVGQFAPDFELQPIEAYPKLAEWLEANRPPATPATVVRYRRGFLGRRRAVFERTAQNTSPAPISVDDKIRLSQLVGNQPVLLLYGSYT